MSNDQKVLANHVVETFRLLLDSKTREAVGEHNFSALNNMVQEVIADHSESSLDRLEDLIKQMRAELSKRPIEL